MVCRGILHDFSPAEGGFVIEAGFAIRLLKATEMQCIVNPE
jgi:hypothetical protein